MKEIGEINLDISERRKSGCSVKGVSDKYHTFGDYIDIRNLWFIAYCNERPDISWKSLKHYDEVNDPICNFNDDFIAGVNTPLGPVAQHLKMEYWNLLDVPKIEKAPKYDGYTFEDSKERIKSLYGRNTFLKETVRSYVPCDKCEEIDKAQMLMFIDHFDNVLTRDNLIGHFSASAFVINKKRTKMALVYNSINDSWSYPSRHADGEEDLLSVAYREVREEVGLNVNFLSLKPFLIFSNSVNQHVENGMYIPAHIHFDTLYLMEADDSISLEYRSDSLKEYRWILFDKFNNENMVDYVEPIAKKVLKKINNYGLMRE